MFRTYQVKIRQTRKLSQKIAGYARECDDVYDMAIMVKLAHPKTSAYDMINLIPGWRREFGLKGATAMHEQAALQARRAVIAFWKSNSRKHARRVRHKNEIRQGKRSRYKHNRWTEPSSLMRRNDKSERLKSLSCRREPKMKGDGCIQLTKLGVVRVKTEMPGGRLMSFQLKDVTKKFTGRTKDGDRKFLLLVQVNVPDPEPVAGKTAGIDYGGITPATTSDEHGNERLYRHSGGCARQKGDKINHLRKELSRYVKGSRNHKKAKRVLSRESRRISNKQDNDEWRIARSITAGVACLAIEDPKRLNFAAMRAKGGNRKKGMNRTMSYSRPGALRAKTIQKMEERGGTVHPVDPRNTSLRCPRCYFACKESRDCEDYDCIMCGWYHHADKNGASNIKLICLHAEAGGRVHQGGTVITDSDAVERREGHGAANSERNLPTGRLEPDNADMIRPDRTPKRAQFVVAG